jgi:hypothetical protein
MVYPRVYKATKESIFVSWASGCILTGAYTQFLIQSPYKLISPEVILLFLAIISCLYIFTIHSIGYKVILMSDSIKVTTLFSSRELYRNDIASYSSYFGRFDSGLILVAKGTRLSKYEIKEEKLIIHLSFERDNEFDNWLSTLPCELSQTDINNDEKFNL